MEYRTICLCGLSSTYYCNQKCMNIKINDAWSELYTETLSSVSPSQYVLYDETGDCYYSDSERWTHNIDKAHVFESITELVRVACANTDHLSDFIVYTVEEVPTVKSVRGEKV